MTSSTRDAGLANCANTRHTASPATRQGCCDVVERTNSCTGATACAGHCTAGELVVVVLVLVVDVVGVVVSAGVVVVVVVGAAVAVVAVDVEATVALVVAVGVVAVGCGS